MSLSYDELSTSIKDYCHLLARFNYDKAKDFMDELKVKHASAHAGDGVLPASVLFAYLSQLVLTEKSYMSGVFLLSKGFLRKEGQLRTNFNTIRTELSRLCGEDRKESFVDENSEERCKVLEIVKQFRDFVSCRIEMMNLYEKLSQLGLPKGLTADVSIGIVELIIETNVGCLAQDTISPLHSSVRLECDVLRSLLKAHKFASILDFINTLIELQACHGFLEQWSRQCGVALSTHQLSWFNFTSSQKSPHQPALRLWLKKYYDFLLSKFSFYFYETLLKNSGLTDLKTQFTKVPENYIQRITNFQRRSDASNILVVLNAWEMPDYNSLSYVFPGRIVESLKGLENYPTVYSYPSEKTAVHLPSIVMIITNNAQKLSVNMEKIVYVFDEQKQWSYFVCLVEPALYLAVTFANKKSEKDSHVSTFAQEFCSDLRGARIFSSLRQSVK